MYVAYSTIGVWEHVRKNETSCYGLSWGGEGGHAHASCVPPGSAPEMVLCKYIHCFKIHMVELLVETWISVHTSLYRIPDCV